MRVTVVGSISPSTYLARGEKLGPIELTDQLRKLIKGGYVNVVERHDDPLPKEEKPEPKEVQRKRPGGGSGQSTKAP